MTMKCQELWKWLVSPPWCQRRDKTNVLVHCFLLLIGKPTGDAKPGQILLDGSLFLKFGPLKIGQPMIRLGLQITMGETTYFALLSALLKWPILSVIRTRWEILRACIFCMTAAL